LKKKAVTSGSLLIVVISVILSFYLHSWRQPRHIRTSTPPAGTYQVTHVTDGDTIVLVSSSGGPPITCRLYGIDAPETAKRGKPGQPYGSQAMVALKRLVLNEEVGVTFTGERTYNREVCTLEKHGTDINREMIRHGYAWAYVEYLKRPHASNYISAEEEARNRKAGLWKAPNPQPPWEFRQRLRSEDRG
jgi:endonuclease YncB( thermonuclease family)